MYTKIAYTITSKATLTESVLRMFSLQIVPKVTQDMFLEFAGKGTGSDVYIYFYVCMCMCFILCYKKIMSLYTSIPMKQYIKGKYCVITTFSG